MAVTLTARERGGFVAVPTPPPADNCTSLTMAKKRNGCTIYNSYKSTITGICLRKNMYTGMLLETSVEPVRVQHEFRDR
jgi:hypothetical protein